MSAQLNETAWAPSWRPITAKLEAAPWENEEQFLAIRRGHIGASDVACVLGVNPFKTTYQFYLEFTGEVERPDLSGNEAVQLGHELEPVAAGMYGRRTGRRVERVRRALRRIDRPWLIANLDRRVVGEPRCVEIKTAGMTNGGFVGDEWGEEGTDQIPLYHMAQVQAQLAVTGYREVDVAALLAGVGFRIYTVRRDEDLIRSIDERVQTFYEAALRGEPPAPTTVDDATLRWPTSAAREVVATPDVITLLQKYRVLDADVDALEAQRDAIKMQIIAYMEDADTLVDGRGRKLLTFKSSRAFDEARARELYPDAAARAVMSTFDREAFKAAVPANAYDACLAPSGSRRFSLGKEK